jgi:hypothetical protein
MKLIGTQIIFPQGSQNYVGLSQASPGPLPCPGGTMIAPFVQFAAVAPGMNRWFRLKGIYFDENAAGQNNVQVMFNINGVPKVTFTFPTVSSGQGVYNFHYSDWYQPNGVDGNFYDVTAFFNSGAPYDNHAGIWSLILEAYDVYSPGTAADHSYVVTLANESPLTLSTHNDDPIAPGTTWTSEALGNGYVTNPLLGTLSFYDIGKTHIGDDSDETWGCLISLRGYQYVGRYDANGQLSVTVNALLQAFLGGLDLTPISLDALDSSGG